MNKIKITLEHTDVMKPRPYPIHLDADYKVTSGLLADDGSYLVGFGPAGEKSVTVLAEQAVADPSSVVGMTASFSNGGIFLWDVPVATFAVEEA